MTLRGAAMTIMYSPSNTYFLLFVTLLLLGCPGVERKADHPEVATVQPASSSEPTDAIQSRTWILYPVTAGRTAAFIAIQFPNIPDDQTRIQLNPIIHKIDAIGYIDSLAIINEDIYVYINDYPTNEGSCGLYRTSLSRSDSILVATETQLGQVCGGLVAMGEKLYVATRRGIMEVAPKDKKVHLALRIDLPPRGTLHKCGKYVVCSTADNKILFFNPERAESSYTRIEGDKGDSLRVCCATQHAIIAASLNLETGRYTRHILPNPDADKEEVAILERWLPGRQIPADIISITDVDWSVRTSESPCHVSFRSFNDGTIASCFTGEYCYSRHASVLKENKTVTHDK